MAKAEIDAKVEAEVQQLREQLADDGGQRDEWFKALTTITKLEHQLAAAQMVIAKEVTVQTAPNIKATVAANYLDTLRDAHGHKEWKTADLRVVLTGAMKPGSIGEQIGSTLQKSGRVTEMWGASFDVRHIGVPAYLSRPFDEFNTLILCHGVTHLDWFENCPWDKMEEMIEVNLLGTARVIQAFVRDTLNSEERKRIIVIGSMAHRQVLNGSAIYCASKAGLAMLCRCLAWELAPKGFDVFCIHPSNTEGTPMTKDTVEGLMRYRGLSKEGAEAYWNDSPLREKMLQTDDISALVMFLLGEHGAYLAGAQLELAGGQR